MKLIVDKNIVLHPIPSYEVYMEDLINDILVEPYNSDDYIREAMDMKLSLDKFPDENFLGMTETYARVQGYISRTASIIMEMIAIRSNWLKYQNRLNQLYFKAKSYYYIHDITIKSLRNKELQEAGVQEKIPHVVALKYFVDMVLSDLKDSLDIVREKKEELDKLNTNINRQQKIVESLINLGYKVKINYG